MKPPTEQLSAYILSSYYPEDLMTIRHAWLGQKVLGTAGMFMFLSYITLPNLLIVQPLCKEPRTVTMRLGLAEEQEKRFLQRILGLSTGHEWAEGICNIRVREMMAHLYQRHLSFKGMQPEYLDYFGGVMALSVLRVHTIYGSPLDREARARYWRYMRHALSLLGANLCEETDTEAACHLFIQMYTHPTPQGRLLLQPLQTMYPDYVNRALPVLFPETRLTIERLQEAHYA